MPASVPPPPTQRPWSQFSIDGVGIERLRVEIDADPRKQFIVRGSSGDAFRLAIGIVGDVLTPWCDEAHGVADLGTLEPTIANALFS